MIALVGAVFLASLLGSAHCAGMCGGFVCFVAGQNESRVRAHAAYHLGRLVSYVALGVLAGAAGAGIDRLGLAAGVSRLSAPLAGVLMVLWGGASLARAAGRSLGSVHPAPVPIARVLRAMAGRPPEQRALALGVLTTLLPCGWLYAFVATAAGVGSPWGGAAVMAVFWVGTVPALVAVALVARRAFGPIGRRLPALTSGMLIVLGLLTAAGKFHAPRAGTPPGSGIERPASAGVAGVPASPTCHDDGGGHGDR